MLNINYYFENRPAQYGDIISVNRGFYRHYGVYLRNNIVIHYASTSGSILQKATIHATNLSNFLSGAKGYTVCAFPSGYNNADTVKRALSRIGESNYDLFRNNCEHFATWCKTGVAYCKQI